MSTSNLHGLYFAHAVNTYNTPFESAALRLIAKILPGVEIENPNQPRHQVGYKKWAERAHERDTAHKGMSYFFDEVLPHCGGCIAMPFLDGRIGLGVAGEARWFLEKKLPVWAIMPMEDLSPERIEGFVTDPDNGLFQVRLLMESEEDKLRNQDPVLVVPHEETRLRTWIVYNRLVRPYQTAHEVSMPIPEGFYPEK